MTVAVAHQSSPAGRAALAEAIREVRRRETDLAVVHVADSLDEDRKESYRLGISDEIEQTLGDEQAVRWTLHLSTTAGSTAEEVLRLAKQAGPELIVVGARRRSPVGKALLGSVAQSVILDADVPVLVVKAAT